MADKDRERLYECTVFTRPEFKGDTPRPMTIEGRVVSKEIVAQSASKARYSWYLDLRDGWEDIKLMDIHVRSLARSKRAPANHEQVARMATANEIISVIARHGRRFFSENADRTVRVDNPFIAHFVWESGELWFVDSYTRKKVLVRHDDWPGFTNGGTLRGVVKHLAAYIEFGTAVDIGYFSPSPTWVCNGDLWGYGADMDVVQKEVSQCLK